jgi:hypothetical protein
MQEAVLPKLLDDEDAQAWLLHTEEVIVSNVATALGSAKLEALSAAKEAAGDFVGAARVAWAARSAKQLPAALSADLAYRTTALLELANDLTCADFEIEVLGVLNLLDMGSERHAKALTRKVAVAQTKNAGATQTFSSLWAGVMAELFAGIAAWNFWVPPRPLPDVRAANLQIRQQAIQLEQGVHALTDVVLVQRHFPSLVNAFCLVITSATCDMDDWNPELCGGEAALVEAMDHWAKTDAKCGWEAKNGDVTMNAYL